MQLLIDTDIFCKLAIGECLDDTMGLFGVDVFGCGRLSALPHMLRRGKLRKNLGDQICDELIPIAESFPALVQPSAVWLDRLTTVQTIDPGEAQIFALAAEKGIVVVTGDKRALRSLKDIPAFTDALAGRIVVLEAVLFVLCGRLGSVEIRRRVQRLLSHDKMVNVCLSPNNSDPKGALLSYYRSLEVELAPLVLWNPQMGAQK